MKISNLSLAVSLATTGLMSASHVFAQDLSSENNAGPIEEVVVTGVGSVKRTSFDTPLSVNSFDETEIARLAASSNADILRNVPGISAEGGGGEVAVNLFVPGLPAAGQYAFTPLNYDNFTVVSYFGLNSSSFDVYHRSDIGLERVEVVRGGVSNLFGPGSVAGILNFISKKGSIDPEAKVELEVAEEGRVATNFAVSGPVGESTSDFYALSGYYRYDEGPIDTGLETKGYQIKGNYLHEFEDGSGNFAVYGQVIDDDVQFFLPLPLDADSDEFARGNNGSEVRTIQTDALDNFVYPTANGLRDLRVGDGVETSGSTIAVEINKEYESGWAFGAKAKYSEYTHYFNLFIPAGGDAVLSTEAFLAQQGLDGFENATFTNLNTGQTLSDSDLVYRTQAWDRRRPVEDVTAQFDLSKSFEINGLEHNFTGGIWLSRADADDFNNRVFYLSEFNDSPDLLALSVSGDDLNTAETETGTRHYSVNGFAGSGGHVNAGGSATRQAFYFADQIEADRWNFDIGFRFERFSAEYFDEGSQSAVIDPSLYAISDGDIVLANLQNDTIGNGIFTRLDVDATAWAGAIAGLYRINDQLNVYGNLSRGFFWPQARTLPGQVNNVSGVDNPIAFVENQFEEEIIDRIEVGLKLDTELFTGSIGLYNLQLSDSTTFRQVEQDDGTFEVEAILQETDTTGIDASGTFYFGSNFSVDVNLTYADHEFTAGPNDGNEIRRQPNFLAGSSFKYETDTFDASLSYSYRGDSFGDDSNNRELDGFGFWRAQAGYNLPLSGDDSLRIALSIFNLTDEEGLTEGNPRAGTGPQGDFAVGRPILPRRASLKLTYTF